MKIFYAPGRPTPKNPDFLIIESEEQLQEVLQANMPTFEKVGIKALYMDCDEDITFDVVIGLIQAEINIDVLYLVTDEMYNVECVMEQILPKDMLIFGIRNGEHHVPEPNEQV